MLPACEPALPIPRRNMKLHRILWTLPLVVSGLLLIGRLFSAAAAAGPINEPTGKVDFQRDVQPLLAARCMECHGPEKREGGLRFTNRDDALLPTDSGASPIVPGDSTGSELIRRVTSEDDSQWMPPEGPRLTADDVKLLRAWIDQGAKWTAEGMAAEHWAFVAPVRPELPAVRNASWPANPIDYFILARLEREGLSPSPPVERARLIRRVYLDLIGLPPTVEQVEAFERDTRPGAYKHVVDDLLASPQYGERWARPWLDLARYADSNGFQRDGFREVWAYRDWVIRALNDDLPFDQFTIWQVAGDLLPNATPDQKVATGFQRCTTVNVEAGTDQEENRVNAIIDRVNTTATVWLGATIACAQCHNHKYDPLTQREYYQLFSYFNNTRIETAARGNDEASGRDFVGPWIDLAGAVASGDRRQVLERRVASLAEQLNLLTKEFAEGQAEWEREVLADAAALEKLPPATRKLLETSSDQRTKQQRRQLANYYVGLQEEIKELRVNLAAAKKDLETLKPPTTLVMEELAEPRMTSVFKRGNFLDMGPQVEAGVPAALHPLREDAPANRLGLAQWLVDERNPLIGRVTVNRWWAEFFGQGLVATPEDFGTQGEPATHPELLDWLATEFIRGGWSQKAIHRLIVTSATYRQSSKVSPSLLARDPQNRLYARGPRLRLPAETIRDNALAISGLLSDKLGGPPVYPPQPEGIWRVTGQVDNNYYTSQGDDRYRRGVYVIWRRSAPYPSFVNFDAPERSSCVVQRPRTNTPLQALTLLNDPVYVEMALALAQRIATATPSEDIAARAEYGFQLCMARRPREHEARLLADVFRRELAHYRADRAAARKLLGQRKPPAGVSAAELAAWFHVANILLNLDETITKG
jgi:hypothetical protein